MKHFYKPLILIASLFSIGKIAEAKFTTEKITLSFGSGALSFKNEGKKSDNKPSEKLDESKSQHNNDLTYYPNNLLSLKVLLRSVSTTNNKSATSIASINGASESLKEPDNKAIIIENFNVNCVEKREYLLSCESTTFNAKGNLKISYLDEKNKPIEVYQTQLKSGVKVNYTAIVKLNSAANKPSFKIEFEDLNKNSTALASVSDVSDADGEMVDIITQQEESALFVKTISGKGGEYKLDIYDENGSLVIANQEIEIMAGSSQIIPMDLPASEHGTYLAVLSNQGSKKKKKTFKITH